MKKFLVYLVTFIVCVGVVAGAAIHTIHTIDLEGFVNDFDEAMKTTTKAESPTDPDDKDPVQNDPTVDENQGGEDQEDQEDQEDENSEDVDIKDIEEVKELFAVLYEQYSPKSHEIQEKTLKNIIESNIDVSNSSNSSYIKFVDAYIDSLYKEIEKLKGDESADPSSPEEIAKQQEFVEKEAPAYEYFVDIMSGVMVDNKEYKPTSSEINETVEAIIQSEICKSTINTVSNNSGIVSVTQDSMQYMDAEVSANIKKALENNYNGSEISQEICEGLATLFGIELDR